MRDAQPTLRGLAICSVLASLGCGVGDGGRVAPPAKPDDPYRATRDAMVAEQIEARGIRDPAVLAAMRRVPRHRFVQDDLSAHAYIDRPLPIGHQQTISQPYIVAAMTEHVGPRPDMRVLEIGTGSGYQAAVLAECVREVYTIEILPELGRLAASRLAELGYTNVHVRIGDGYDGWPEEAPFDAIVVTAAPPTIPQPLLDQLAVGGRLVIPVGEASQAELLVVTRTAQGFERRTAEAVRFVPMTGKAQEGR